MFVEKYVGALCSQDLRDDELHRATEALAAAALADLSGGSSVVFGSMLVRAKVAGVPRQMFESSTLGLAPLITGWHDEVERRGKERKWVKIGSDRDVYTAHALYKRVAEKSLAHWLNPTCVACNGTKVVHRVACKACAGTGEAPIECTSQYERERVKDMVSDLEGIYQSHCARAGAKLRKAA